MVASLPANEKDRIQALRRYAILDTPPEPAFDRIISLVARLLKVPIATVTLVDEHRQWFKAYCGLDESETDRDIAFCSHAILQDEMLIVPDTHKDPRFVNNPLVTGKPYIRFYAGMPLKGYNGSNIGVLCAIDTVPREFSSEQQAILEDLAEIVNEELRFRLATLEKNLLAAAVNHVNAGVIVTDPNQPGNPIIYCNPAFTEITGYEPEEAIGRSCRFLQGEHPDPEQQEIAKAIAERRPYRGLLLNYRKNGEPFWNSLLISPVFDEQGNLLNFVGLQHDVTDRKRDMDTLQENFERLKELERLRDSLTNMIIHDLRSPLSVTMGYLDFLRGEISGKLDEEELDLIRRARESADEINVMITSLLDVSRLESGKMPLDITESNLEDITQWALADELTLKGVRLKLELPAEPVPVRCDLGLISRVIGNLVGNAFKYSPEESTVTVRIASDEGKARFFVTDAGPGIPLEDQKRIFEKFGQVKGTRRVHSTGLGLTFCKLAIEAQGGSIGVNSEVGRGSTFWFSLPAATRK